MCVKLKHTKFQPSNARGTLSNSELIGQGVRKNVHFSMENWPYLRNDERYRKCYY